MFCFIQFYTPRVLFWVLASNKAKLIVNRCILTFHVETNISHGKFQKPKCTGLVAWGSLACVQACTEGQRQDLPTCSDADTWLFCAVPCLYRTTQTHPMLCSFLPGVIEEAYRQSCQIKLTLTSGKLVISLLLHLFLARSNRIIIKVFSNRFPDIQIALFSATWVLVFYLYLIRYDLPDLPETAQQCPETPSWQKLSFIFHFHVLSSPSAQLLTHWHILNGHRK